MGPPSLEEAVGDLAKQSPQVFAQRFAEMGVDLGRSDTCMSQQNLDDAYVHAVFQQVRGKAVSERVRPESMIEAALASCFDESIPRGGVGKRSDNPLTGKQPAWTAMCLPDLSQHFQHGFGQWESTLLVAFADHSKEQPFGVHGRHRQGDGFPDPQSVGVNEREAAAINGLSQGGDQAATIRIRADVGQSDVPWLANFFFVNKGHS